MNSVTELFKEVSPLSDKDCFIIIERLKSTFNFPIHVHPEYEINFIENAKGAQRIVGDSVETIDDEELVLITNPSLEHAWIDHECKSDNIYEVTIQFHASSIPQDLLERNQFNSIKVLFQRANKGLLFGKETCKKVRPILKTMACERDGFYSVLKLLTLLHELSIADDMRELASDSFIGQIKEKKEKTGERISKVLDFLKANYDQQIRLAEVAGLVNMSEAAFCRFIKQRTSKSFVDLLNDIRLGVAIRSLIDSTDTVAEIGYACGFNNLSNFNRIFKKKKKMSPSEFRTHYRKKKVIV